MLRTSSLVVCLALVVFACSSGGTSTESADASTTQDDADATSVSGVHVSVAIASATLGDEGCSGASAEKAGDFAACAPTQDGGCTGLVCRPSSVQLQFTADASGSAAPVSIGEVLLLDSTGATLETLTASAPTKWDAATSTYVVWDQTVAASGEVKASYRLSAPTYSNGSGKTAYSATYRLRITVVIDGTSVVVESAPLNREPVVAT